MARALVGRSPPSERAQIVGLDAHGCCNDSETRELVLTHVRALRERPCLRDAAIVLVPEDNLGNEAQSLASEVLERVPESSIISQNISTGARGRTSGRDDRYGVKTLSHRVYVLRFGDLLASGGVRYHAELVSVNPFVTNKSAAERATAARTAFEMQFTRFRHVVRLPPALTAREQEVYSGKVDQNDQKSSRRADDYVMAMLLGAYWSREFIAGRVRAVGYTQRLVRADVTHMPSVVRHSEYGEGRDFAEREAAARARGPVLKTRALPSDLTTAALIAASVVPRR